MATKKKAATTGKAGKKSLIGGSGDSAKGSDLKGSGGPKGGGTKAAKKKK